MLENMLHVQRFCRSLFMYKVQEKGEKSYGGKEKSKIKRGNMLCVLLWRLRMV